MNQLSFEDYRSPALSLSDDELRRHVPQDWHFARMPARGQLEPTFPQGLFDTCVIPAGHEAHREVELRRWAAMLPRRAPVWLEAPFPTTVARWGRARPGVRKPAHDNPNFLNAEWFVEEVWGPARAAFGRQLQGVIFRFPNSLRAAGFTAETFGSRLQLFFRGLPPIVNKLVSVEEESFRGVVGSLADSPRITAVATRETIAMPTTPSASSSLRALRLDGGGPCLSPSAHPREISKWLGGPVAPDPIVLLVDGDESSAGDMLRSTLGDWLGRNWPSSGPILGGQG